MSDHFVCPLCDEWQSLNRKAELDLEMYPEMHDLDPNESYCDQCITYMEDEIQSERHADLLAMKEDT